MTKSLKEYFALVKFCRENTDLSLTEKKFFCDVCEEEKKYNPREEDEPFKAHLKTPKHLGKKDKKKEKGLDFPLAGTVKLGFHFEPVRMLIATNTPINRVDDAFLNSFLRNETIRNKDPPLITENLLSMKFSPIINH
ncbi:unnamed protein product [Dimorphilus gyrociliatus]|uniref:Uncharacterized protein n=1 Tax=Dimorphilus gyrociliatus TaxID=2664684 RepID=A0A7I8WEK9_9ANNE|nr:unnamed protein product [Dimorphilus gyrociliatus]